MDKSNIKALIDLIDDPDNEVYSVVRKKLLDEGEKVIPVLENAWERSLNPTFQERIENIIHRIQLDNVKKSLDEWSRRESPDLVEGAYWIAKYQYPELSYDNISENIDAVKGDVWLELNDNLTALEKIRILNHIIFDIHGFKGSITNIHSPNNAFINQVMETKKGNPVSLAIIYCSVAQRSGLPVYGVDLPGNMILAYEDEKYARVFGKDDRNAILFYINPFNRGAVFGTREIDSFIEKQKLETSDSYFISCSNQVVIRNLVEQLITSYKKLGYPEKVDELEELAEIFKKY